MRKDLDEFIYLDQLGKLFSMCKFFVRMKYFHEISPWQIFFLIGIFCPWLKQIVVLKSQKWNSDLNHGIKKYVKGTERTLKVYWFMKERSYWVWRVAKSPQGWTKSVLRANRVTLSFPLESWEYLYHVSVFSVKDAAMCV